MSTPICWGGRSPNTRSTTSCGQDELDAAADHAGLKKPEGAFPRRGVPGMARPSCQGTRADLQDEPERSSTHRLAYFACSFPQRNQAGLGAMRMIFPIAGVASDASERNAAQAFIARAPRVVGRCNPGHEDRLGADDIRRTGVMIISRKCLDLARNRHHRSGRQCPVSGAKRKSDFDGGKSEFDPSPTLPFRHPS
jgi:hypothetical protein